MENIFNINHILNRGVEKRKIFLDNDDYLRFINNLSDFNDKNITLLSYKNRRKYFLDKTEFLNRPKNPLVNIVCWSLMPNHYHILTIEKIRYGTSLFSRKITIGYTNYFNLKNNRSGVLFQGRSKIINISKNPHFRHLPFYILSNPLKLLQPNWKEKGIHDHKKTFEFLENYKWSSLPDILGKNNFPEIINKELFFDLFDMNAKQFKTEFKKWLIEYSGMRYPNIQ